MLRKLLARERDRSTRPDRTARAAPARAPQRRKPVLEALENRLLLSADPLGVLAGNGVLSLALGSGDDHAIIERIGGAAAGGDIIAVTLGQVTQQYGDEFLGIVRLLIDAGAGDDWLRILGVTVQTEITGGLGTDTFEWQGRDATWSITALDTGAVETVTFSSFEHLAGGDATRDTFLFAAGAAVSGGVEGGAGGFDSIVIQGGDYERITYTAVGPDAGTIALEDQTIAFDGIEPVTLGATAAELALHAGTADDVARLRDDAAAGATVLESVGGTFADVAFLNPSVSLTINLGGGDDRITIEALDGGFAAAFDVRGADGRDRIDFDGAVSTGGHDLAAAAETIVVTAGSVLRTDRGPDGAAGDLVLAAAAAGTTGAADAAVTITGGTLIAQNILISASASFTLEATSGEAAAAVVIDGGSEVVAGDTLAIDVRSLVAATGAPGGAAPTVSSTAEARIGGAATLAAGGDIAIDVASAVELTAAQAAAATVAIETTALVESGAALVAQDIRLHAESDPGFAIGDAAALAPAEWLPAAAAEPALDPVAGDTGFADDFGPVPTARPLPEASERPAAADAVAGEWRWDAAAADFALVELPDLDPATVVPLTGALIAARSTTERPEGPQPALRAEDEADPRGSRAAERSEDEDDGGLGASLALSVLKDSALAELARSVASGGGTVVMAAGGAPFARSRARGGAEGIDVELAGALELRDGDAGGTVVLAEPAEGAADAVVASGELVLATAARPDLVAEADGGADRGTAVTGATAIDFAREATREAGTGDTFTSARRADGVDAPGAADEAAAGGLAGLALSTDLPPLAFEYCVGACAGDAIRSADAAGAPVTADTIAVSGLLVDASSAPVAAPGREHDVAELVRCLDAEGGDAAADDAPIGGGREVVIAYVGALAAPIAGSVGLTRHARRLDGGGARARADAVRAGGAWTERFVNDLGLPPEDGNPNAKIKLKI